MLYEKLAQLYKSLSSTTKRLEKTEILSEFLKETPKEESEIIHLIQGNIYPDYDQRKLGISEQLAIKSISKSFGTTPEKVTQEWKKVGDIGEVAKNLCKTKKQTTLFGSISLTTTKVLDNLQKIPELIGNGTESHKLGIITELLIYAKPIEAKFITRTLIGDMRIGVQESTIKHAILKAFFEGNKDYEPIIQRAIDRTNDLSKIFQISKDEKIEELEKIKLEVGSPIRAMLAAKVSSVEEALKQMGSPLAAEYKYDGFRMLIHKKEGEVTLFTRSLENVTKQFPEIEEYVKEFVKGDSFILDAETIGYDKITKEYTDFQAISQRIRRKHKIEEVMNKLPVELAVFDILFYNGESQIEKPFKERTELVRKIITPHPFKIIPSHMIISSDAEEIKRFYKKALADNQEGLMLKTLDAEYNPGRRVGQMVKLKPEDRDLDLVIIGGEWGTGKRSGWISSYTLACKKDDKYLAVGKVGTGISEKEESGKLTLEQLTNLLKPLIKKEDGKDIEIEPKIIVSVTYQDLQKSTTYKSGYALRFPRITNLREDKPLSEIATQKEIEKAFVGQRVKGIKFG
ncbi:MAG: ATP-dependent DNA ligase [Nanoarchaeota archaeon]|jgi:DNA ligase-1|nr:ATP-dependent DNA ligase [Nanoarchaeota archaeon]